MNLAAMVNGGGGVLKRRALALKNDPDGNGKYISGLSEIRVKTRQVSDQRRISLTWILTRDADHLTRKLWRFSGQVNVPARSLGHSPIANRVVLTVSSP